MYIYKYISVHIFIYSCYTLTLDRTKHHYAGSFYICNFVRQSSPVDSLNSSNIESNSNNCNDFLFWQKFFRELGEWKTCLSWPNKNPWLNPEPFFMLFLIALRSRSVCKRIFSISTLHEAKVNRCTFYTLYMYTLPRLRYLILTGHL
jgi:hypothetical protein